MMTSVNDWLRQKNNSIKVFSELFVALRRQQNFTSKKEIKAHLGYATPAEDNAAGKKRQQNAIAWANGNAVWNGSEYVKEAPLEPLLIKNVPISGFVITDDIKRIYWGGGNVVWRVLDPRGFELEIQSENLMALIQTCGIKSGGEISGNCIWGRDGSGKNILLHESSAEYQDAIFAAEKLKAPNKIGKKVRKIGRIYTCTDGSTVVYIGEVYVTVAHYQNSSAHESDHEPQNHSWIQSPSMERRVKLSKLSYNVPASIKYEAVVQVKLVDNKYEMTKKLVLYKQAPLVLDLNVGLDVCVSNEFLKSFKPAFAGNVAHAMLLAVTTQMIKCPEVVAEPWTEQKFQSTLDTLISFCERYVNQGSQYRSNYPFDRILSYHGSDVLMLPDFGPIGSISIVGENRVYFDKPPRKEYCSAIVAIPATLGVGSFEILWLNSSDLYHVMIPQNTSSYVKTLDVITAENSKVEVIELDAFTSSEQFIDWVTMLYNKKCLCSYTVKESQVTFND